MAFQAVTTPLKNVNFLVKKADLLLTKIQQQHLQGFKLCLENEQSDQRLVPGPDGKPYFISYRLSSWYSCQGDRLVWFVLESQIPHLSSIVAAIGFPRNEEGLPIFVMNLNLKPALEAFNIIMGFRNPENYLDRLQQYLPHHNLRYPKPILTKEKSPDFLGIRSVFIPSSQSIGWSMKIAEKAIQGWASLLKSLGSKSIPSDFPCYYENYRREMLALHDKEGNVFDKVFGEGWGAQLFRNGVFNH